MGAMADEIQVKNDADAAPTERTAIAENGRVVPRWGKAFTAAGPIGPAARSPLSQLPPGQLRRSVAGRKRTTRPGGIPAGLPVRGFRAIPVLRGLVWNIPKRRSTTQSPRARADATDSNSASTASCAAADSRAVAAIARRMRMAFTMPVAAYAMPGSGDAWAPTEDGRLLRRERRARADATVRQCAPSPGPSPCPAPGPGTPRAHPCGPRPRPLSPASTHRHLLSAAPAGQRSMGSALSPGFTLRPSLRREPSVTQRCGDAFPAANAAVPDADPRPGPHRCRCRSRLRFSFFGFPQAAHDGLARIGQPVAPLNSRRRTSPSPMPPPCPCRPRVPRVVAAAPAPWRPNTRPLPGPPPRRMS